jgi:hypothetical protein
MRYEYAPSASADRMAYGAFSSGSIGNRAMTR